MPVTLGAYVRAHPNALDSSLQKLTCTACSIEEVDINADVLALLTNNVTTAPAASNQLGNKTQYLKPETYVPDIVRRQARGHLLACNLAFHSPIDTLTKPKGNIIEADRSNCIGSKSGDSGMNVAIAISIHTLLLSRNRITSLLGIIQFRSVVRLSLMCNALRRLEDLAPLAMLPQLAYLSLEFNPVTALPHYRAHVIHLCSSSTADVEEKGSNNRSCCRLRKLDAFPVTPQEVLAATRAIALEQSLLPSLRHRVQLVACLVQLERRLRVHREMYRRALLLVRHSDGNGNSLSGTCGGKKLAALLSRSAPAALSAMDVSHANHEARMLLLRTYHRHGGVMKSRARFVITTEFGGEEDNGKAEGCHFDYSSIIDDMEDSAIGSSEGGEGEEDEGCVLEEVSHMLSSHELSWSRDCLDHATAAYARSSSSSSSSNTGSGKSLSPHAEAQFLTSTREPFSKLAEASGDTSPWCLANYRLVVSSLDVRVCAHMLRCSRMLGERLTSVGVDTLCELWMQQQKDFVEVIPGDVSVAGVSAYRSPQKIAKAKRKELKSEDRRLRPAGERQGRRLVYVAPKTSAQVISVPARDEVDLSTIPTATEDLPSPPQLEDRSPPSAPPPQCALAGSGNKESRASPRRSLFRGEKKDNLSLTEGSATTEGHKSDNDHFHDEDLASLHVVESAEPSPRLETPVPTNPPSASSMTTAVEAASTSMRTAETCASTAAGFINARTTTLSEKAINTEEEASAGIWVTCDSDENVRGVRLRALLAHMIATRKQNCFSRWIGALLHRRQQALCQEFILSKLSGATGSSHSAKSARQHGSPAFRAITTELLACVPYTERKRCFFDWWKRRAEDEYAVRWLMRGSVLQKWRQRTAESSMVKEHQRTWGRNGSDKEASTCTTDSRQALKQACLSRWKTKAEQRVSNRCATATLRVRGVVAKTIARGNMTEVDPMLGVTAASAETGTTAVVVSALRDSEAATILSGPSLLSSQEETSSLHSKANPISLVKQPSAAAPAMASSPSHSPGQRVRSATSLEAALCGLSCVDTLSPASSRTVATSSATPVTPQGMRLKEGDEEYYAVRTTGGRTFGGAVSSSPESNHQPQVQQQQQQRLYNSSPLPAGSCGDGGASVAAALFRSPPPVPSPPPRPTRGSPHPISTSGYASPSGRGAIQFSQNATQLELPRANLRPSVSSPLTKPQQQQYFTPAHPTHYCEVRTKVIEALRPRRVSSEDRHSTPTPVGDVKTQPPQHVVQEVSPPSLCGHTEEASSSPYSSQDVEALVLRTRLLQIGHANLVDRLAFLQSEVSREKTVRGALEAELRAARCVIKEKVLGDSTGVPRVEEDQQKEVLRAVR